MGNGNGLSGLLGLLGVALFVGLYFVSRAFFPALSTAILIVGVVILLLVLAVVGLVLFFAFRKPKQAPGVPDQQDITAILQKGRANLMELRRLSMRAKDPQVRQRSEEICQAADKILRTLREQPQELPRVRQFLNYYLPTLGNILLKYVRLEESGIPAQDTTEKTIQCLGDIRRAMDQLYTNLFTDDILDLTVEMEVLTQVCRQNGLLTDESFHLQEGGRNITLTL